MTRNFLLSIATTTLFMGILAGCSSYPTCASLDANESLGCSTHRAAIVAPPLPQIEIAPVCNNSLQGCGVATSPCNAAVPSCQTPTQPCGQSAANCGTRQSPTAPTKFVAVGHGSVGNQSLYTQGQQKLMAMRAAQVDAYRMLAEQVQGFRVLGNTSISAFAIQNDAVKSYVDAFIRGAQVVSLIAIADGNYEATVELELSSQFLDCLTNFSTCGARQAPIGCTSSGCLSSSAVRISY
ncbi:MAG: LPP20 family lipoprotein [Actinomycetes bacterium]